MVALALTTGLSARTATQAPRVPAAPQAPGNQATFRVAIDYVTTDPPENQECKWTQAPHPPFEDFEPVDVTPGPTCP